LFKYLTKEERILEKKILIEGMSCGNCVRHVKEALGELKGVTGVDVNLEGKYALIEVSAEVTDGDIKSIIEEAGYDVVGIEAL
jgi:copper chaperone